LINRLAITLVSSGSPGRDDRPVSFPSDHPNASARRKRGSRRDGVGDDVAQGHAGEIQVQGAGVDAGQLEEIVDEMAHAVGLDADTAVIVGDGLGVAHDVVLQGFRHGAESGERGAKVVGNPGDEFAATRLHLPFPLANLHRPDRSCGQAAAECRADREAYGRRGQHSDEHDLEVVCREEHGVRDCCDARDHGGDRDRQHDADVRDDRPMAQDSQGHLADEAHRGTRGQCVQTDQHEVTHGRCLLARIGNPRRMK
jgi:hypothetical protein